MSRFSEMEVEETRVRISELIQKEECLVHPSAVKISFVRKPDMTDVKGCDKNLHFTPDKIYEVKTCAELCNVINSCEGDVLAMNGNTYAQSSSSSEAKAFNVLVKKWSRPTSPWMDRITRLLVICPSRGPVSFERNVNLCHLTGISNNDNLCHYTGVSPKTATMSYPQYDDEVVCPPNRFKKPLKLPGELRRFNQAFDERRRVIFCCQPHLPPAYRPVFSVPPAEFWTHVDMCNPWSYFDRSACCDKPRPYNWVNDSCPTPYCRPGGKATPPYAIPYPNLGLYFPPCDIFRVKC